MLGKHNIYKTPITYCIKQSCASFVSQHVVLALIAFRNVTFFRLANKSNRDGKLYIHSALQKDNLNVLESDTAVRNFVQLL